jgi:seryl-tRNA(Sec) selenium transferase
MDQMEERRELERKIEQASRIASRINDPTTYQRLKNFIEELRQRLRQRLAAKRTVEEIRARARELWELEGRPAGRDLDIWLQAERELTGGGEHDSVSDADSKEGG